MSLNLGPHPPQLLARPPGAPTLGAQTLQPPASAPALCRRPGEARPCPLYSIQPPCQQESRPGFPETAPAPTCPAPWPSGGTHTPLWPAGLPAPGAVVDWTQPRLRLRAEAGEDDLPHQPWARLPHPHGLCPEGLRRSLQTQLTPPKRAPLESPSDWYVCVRARMFVHVCVSMWGMHVCVHACACVCVCPCMCGHACICMCMELALPKGIPTRPSWVLSDKRNLSF